MPSYLINSLMLTPPPSSARYPIRASTSFRSSRDRRTKIIKHYLSKMLSYSAIRRRWSLGWRNGSYKIEISISLAISLNRFDPFCSRSKLLLEFIKKIKSLSASLLKYMELSQTSWGSSRSNTIFFTIRILCTSRANTLRSARLDLWS